MHSHIMTMVIYMQYRHAIAYARLPVAFMQGSAQVSGMGKRPRVGST